MNSPETQSRHSVQRMVSRVELAILANGGGDYDEKACECDASVGATPCRYCAIRDALNETLRYLRAQAANAKLGVGDLVITRIKNRWSLECAGTVEALHGDTADVRVWNINGPGADMLVTGIPLDELTKDGETPND